MSKLQLIGLLLAGALGGCAAPLPMQNGQLIPPPGQGYVVLAVTLDSFDPDMASASLVINGPEGQQDLIARIGTDSIRAAGDAPDGKGRLYVRALPAGNYKMEKMYGWWHQEGRGPDGYRYDEVPLNASFTVNAGEVVYVGDAHLSLNFKPSATISDQHQRDFNDLATRRKITQPITVRIATP